MILLHTSDWHLGKSDGDRLLLKDQQFFIDQICEIVSREHVDAVLLAGDIYDRAVASADAIRLYDQAMTRLCMEMHVPVLIIAGNHDSAERIGSCALLLSGAGLHVCGALSREPVVVPFADAEVYLLPWFTEEKVKSVFPEKRDQIDSLADAYRVVTDNIRARFSSGKRHIVLSHAFITGSQTSTSDRAAEIGFATQIGADVFGGFDYVALGHLHGPQDVTRTVRYSGTPMPYAFGKEEQQVKSVTLIDTADMSRREIPLRLLHRRTTLTGTLEELLHPTCGDDVKNGYVRLTVTDVYGGPEVMAMLRDVYPNILELSGKTYEGENSSITMTAEEFEHMADDPIAVFRYFCREEMAEEPDERRVRLFAEAVARAGEEEEA